VSDGFEIQRRSDGPVSQAPPAAPGRRRAGPGWEDGRSDISRYREILARRARTVIWIFVLVVTAVVAGTLLQTPVYRATGMLEVRAPTAGLSPTDVLSSVDRVSTLMLGTERELLSSPAVARRVVTDLELYRLEQFQASGDNDSPASAEIGPGGASDAQIQIAMEHFLDRLTVHPRPESRLVEVSFDFEDPVMAARIVNSTLSSYAAMRMEAARRAVGWLDAQMDSLRGELESSEERLRAYAEEHGLPYAVEEDLTPAIRDRVERLRDDLAAAEARRYEAEALHNLVVRGGDVDAAADGVVEALSIRLSELRREYARISSTFTDDYPEARQVRRQIEELEGLMSEERGRIVRSIESQYRLALRQEEALRTELEEERRAADALTERSGRFYLLRGEVMGNRELYNSLQQKRGEVHVSSALEGTGIGVLDEALPPRSPHRPVLAYNLALALIAGLVLGLGGAFLREFFDDTVQTGQEVDVRPDVPVLALIPSFKSAGSSGNGRFHGAPWPRIDRAIEAGEGGEALSEAFGILRTAVLFRREGSAPRSLLVSSCQPAEGKTTVGMNLALSLKRLDQRVLLVDADMRRPGLSQALGIPSRPGLADHLRKGGNWRVLVRRDRPDPMPDVLPSGGPVADAGELLSHPRMRVLLREAEQEYDMVIVDAPALYINAPDAHILAEVISGVLIVARSGQTSNNLLSRVLETTPNIHGIVVNDLNLKRLPGQYRRYFTPYGYGPSPRTPRGVRPEVSSDRPVLPGWQGFDPESDPVPEEILPRLGAGGRQGEVIGIVPTRAAREGGWAARAAVRLAREWGRAGRRVVLIDLSIRDPDLHRAARRENGKGIVNVIQEGMPVGTVVRSTDDGSFHLIPVGSGAPGPGTSFFRHERWGEVLGSLEKLRATVLLYLPPELPGAGGMLARASSVVLLAPESEVPLLPDGPWADGKIRAVLGPPDGVGEGGSEDEARGVAAASAEFGPGRPPREV